MGASGAARRRFDRTGASSRQDRPSSFRILPRRRRPRASPKGRTLRLVRMIAAGIRVTLGGVVWVKPLQWRDEERPKPAAVTFDDQLAELWAAGATLSDIGLKLGGPLPHCWKDR
jgi:hypothetical protein